MKKLLFLLFITTIAMGQVNLQVSAPATLDQINITDLDVSKLKDSPLLFTVTIKTTEKISMIMHLQVSAKIGNEPEDIIAEARSLPFEVDNILSFTNQDLASGRTGIKSDRTQIYEDKIEKIKQMAQSTGRLPAGTYRIVIELLDSSNRSLIQWERVYEVTSPSRIDLVSPGYQAEVRTQFPIFKWIAPYLKEFEIYVYEKLPNQATPEEVVSGDKNLRWKFKTNDTQIQYPREALPLEDRKTYFWLVKSKISRSRGAEEIRSEIWSFNVKLAPQIIIQPVSNLTPEQKENLKKLIDSFNQSGYSEIVSLLNGIISDFVILINGRPATTAEIQEILELLKDKSRYELEIEEK